MKLKEIKAPPLLNPPLAHLKSWAAITPGDITAMEKEEENPPQFRNPLNIKSYMVPLGLKVQLTGEEINELNKGLEERRKRLDSFQLASQLCLLKRLGLDVEMTPDDEKVIRSGFAASRMSHSGHIDSRVQFLAHIADFYNKPLGLNDDEMEYIRKRLEEARNAGGGAVIAESLYTLKVMGVREKVTHKDMEAMEDTLNSYRDAREGYGISRIHFHLSRILEPKTRATDAAPQQPMPPLKGFIKRP